MSTLSPKARRSALKSAKIGGASTGSSGCKRVFDSWLLRSELIVPELVLEKSFAPPGWWDTF